MSATSHPHTPVDEYALGFTERGRESLNDLEPVEIEQATRKLERICSCEFRKPREWGFERMDGVSDGRLSLSDELRAFVDIDQSERTLLVYRVYRRENLYG